VQQEAIGSDTGFNEDITVFMKSSKSIFVTQRDHPQLFASLRTISKIPEMHEMCALHPSVHGLVLQVNKPN